MKRYEQIKDLDIYKDRPELLEAYCQDAQAAMQRGFALDVIKNDPEQIIDKGMVKSYAKELRNLSDKNDAIIEQLDRDVLVLIQAKAYLTLSKINAAGFLLNDEVMIKVTEAEKNAKLQSDIKILQEKAKQAGAEPAFEEEIQVEKKVEIVNKVEELTKPENIEKEVVLIEKPTEKVEVVEQIEPEAVAAVDISVKQKPQKKLTKIEFYTQSLAGLKDELYALREEENEELMACLNDITAINYWMLKVLEHEKQACERRDATKQMKSYDKASAISCGRGSMRYIEWHGRIKPYVGKKLFEAEAGCSR